MKERSILGSFNHLRGVAKAEEQGRAPVTFYVSKPLIQYQPDGHALTNVAMAGSPSNAIYIALSKILEEAGYTLDIEEREPNSNTITGVSEFRYVPST